MATPRKHRCGGTLQECKVQIQNDLDGIVMVYRVSGFLCDKCGDELVERDTMVSLEKSQTPTMIWNEPATSKLPVPIFQEPASTAA